MQKSTPAARAPHEAPDNAARVSFYAEPPPADAEIGLDEFEDWAVDRMRVLDALDACYTRAPAEIERTMRPVLAKRLPATRAAAAATRARERVKDTFSHYILRLAFCQRPQDRRRFVKLETELFKLRFEMEPPAAKARFLSESGLGWQRATPDELSVYSAELQSLRHTDLALPVYKFPMEECTELLARRLVFVRHGIAFVPESLQTSVLAHQFAQRLHAALELLAQRRQQLADDSRLDAVLRMANEGFARDTGAGAEVATNAQLTSASLDALDAQQFLPLCMSRLYQSLKKTHHAFFPERNQFIRFLKSTGMPFEEVIKLYAAFYADFDRKKDIEYSIKHWYGLVGSRKNYQPETCALICKNVENQKPDVASGCPFQKLAPARLEQLLRAHNISDDAGIAEIKRLSADNRVHLACSRTYELTHPGDAKHEPILTPNEYFDRAWALARKNEAKGADTGAGTGAAGSSVSAAGQE